MTKIVILADLHLKQARADHIIKSESPDKIICLSDCFDDFGDTPELNKEMAKWLKPKLHDPKYVFLLGNHDAHYAFTNNYLKCSGFTEEKFKAINSILTQEDWNKLKWYYFESDILFTHAGLSRHFIKCNNDGIDINWLRDYLEKESIKANKAIKNNKPHWFYTVGSARGGRGVGGIIWCDFRREFIPIPGLRQVTGHTPTFLLEPEWKAQSLDLDTHLNHYAILLDNKITIKNYSDL